VPKRFFLLIIEPFFSIKYPLELSKEPYATEPFFLRVYNAESNMAKEIKTVLKTFDLTQHVHGPTHNRGHTLDSLINTGSNISSIVITVTLSDDFCIIFDKLVSCH